MAATPAEFLESDTCVAAKHSTNFKAEAVTAAKVAMLGAEVMLAEIYMQNAIPEALAVVETRITRAGANAANIVAERKGAETHVEHATVEAVSAGESKITRELAAGLTLALAECDEIVAKHAIESATKFAAELAGRDRFAVQRETEFASELAAELAKRDELAAKREVQFEAELTARDNAVELATKLLADERSKVRELLERLESFGGSTAHDQNARLKIFTDRYHWPDHVTPCRWLSLDTPTCSKHCCMVLGHWHGGPT